MSKLRNIKAIEKMLAGEHRLQKRTSVPVGQQKRGLARSHEFTPGQCWHDQNLVTGQWTTFFKHTSGYVTKATGKWDSFDDYRKSGIGGKIDWYSECKPTENAECVKHGSTPSQADIRISRRTGMCLSCLTKHELSLQLTGQFDEYAMGKMRQNVKSWLRNQELELRIWKDDLRAGTSTVINGDGLIERYASDPEPMIERVEREFDEFRTSILENYGIDDYEN